MMITSILNFSIGLLVAIIVNMEVTSAAPQFGPIAIQPRVLTNEISTPGDLSSLEIFRIIKYACRKNKIPESDSENLMTRCQFIQYEYHYKVEHSPTNTFYGKQESGDGVGRVTGSYYVYLPDKRLMTVEYLVNGDSGFVPKISFSNQASFPGATRL